MSVIETEPIQKPNVEPTLDELTIKRNSSSVLALRRARNEQNPNLKQAIYEHVYNQETTHLSEILLDGKVKTEIDFETQNGRLYAVDETGLIDWEKFHENNWTYANLLVANNPEMEPYLKIVEAETEHGIEQQRTAASGKPKTMVVLSLCGDDILPAGALEVLGRNPNKQRAMLRVSVFDGSNLKLFTRSIDGMDLAGGKQFYKRHFGIELPEDFDSADILASPVIFDEAKHNLADELARAQDGIDTYRFVLAQKDLLETYLNCLEQLADSHMQDTQLAGLANDLRYDVMSSFKKRLRGGVVYANTQSIASAGNEDRMRGETHDGCDMVIASVFEKTGLGIKSNEMNIDCVKCPACSKIVSLDRDYYRAGFLRCPECKTTKAYKRGAKLPKGRTKRYNENQEGFFEWWMRQKQIDKLNRDQKQLRQKSA